MRGMVVADVLSTIVENGETRVNLGNAMSGVGEAQEAGIWCTANVLSVPEPFDANGACQAIYMTDGQTVRVIGYRDNRNAEKAGALVPGDFAVVNSGNARILVKKEKDSIALYTENGSEESILLSLSGSDDSILVSHGGGSFVEMKSDKVVISGGGCSIEMSNGTVTITANYIALNAMKGNIGVMGAVAPLAQVTGIMYGPTSVAPSPGLPSINWAVAP